MAFLLGLRCKICGRVLAAGPVSVCNECCSPLEPVYDYDTLRTALRRETLEERPQNFWRYRELYPLGAPPAAPLPVGFTPLLRARNLEKATGHRSLYIKNDAVSFPTLSFRDRIVAVALNKAVEFGYDTIACSSSGNLASSVSAQAAFAGLKCVVFAPAEEEDAALTNARIYGAAVVRVKGNCEAVNSLCSQISQTHHWAFLNANLGAYYAEGLKSIAYEIAEQLGWRLPHNVVAPAAAGSLIERMNKGFRELERLGWVDEAPVRILGARSNTCVPTLGLASSTPAHPAFAEPAREPETFGARVSDSDILEGIRLLAVNEGIFTEAAGGASVSAFLRLFREGRISPNETTVLFVSGNGLKTAEAGSLLSSREFEIAPTLNDFESRVLSAPPRHTVAAAASRSSVAVFG